MESVKGRIADKSHELKGRIADKSHELINKWEEKSREFIANFLQMFGRDGMIVSCNCCLILDMLYTF